MKTYSAEETANLTGISKATLRYYEEEKIIGPIRRNTNHYRRYTEADLEWINVIKRIREIGVPVRELRGVTETEMNERLEGLLIYQQKVRKQIQQLRLVDEFLKNKIDYMKNITK
ncbi:MerR family transcriptional regulator [Lentilactobacillus senioris]|uniref:MerR family transcriptional regulator n=1 Tax=Lentilactobacillus senioris TaxID=931534 RepID=UPI002282E0D1|nr:MerR family transcriptional regulator [Lentilactobacillus senioris]MCY9807378.1 MerR family transcriptional regulator [Lentilactobacillus senioris]